MLKIERLTVENLETGCVTDNPNPRISFSLGSDKEEVKLDKAVIKIGEWQTETDKQLHIPYAGPNLMPFTKYAVSVRAADNYGESTEAVAEFMTGRLDTPWQAKWITDASYDFAKKESPLPMTFRKRFNAGKIQSAYIYATALGIYELRLNGKKVGDEYFAPGFTSYEHQIQYQTYDVTDMLESENGLTAIVGGGWAAGAFTYGRKNKISADRQALMLELRIVYEGGKTETVVTDTSWQVTQDGNFRFADWYDGETYDATVDLDKTSWKPVSVTSPRGNPVITASYGLPVKAQERLEPINSFKAKSGEIIYDFGQNFAGVIHAELKGSLGQKVVFRHAEVLVNDELFVKALRTAKATAAYICRDGEQEYSPTMTYMGFRYVGVSGIDADKIKLSALVLHSDFAETGSFECSNELINKLQSNIRWGGKSNFVDIPTDCPQRDERMGWTGDIAVFASTACFNFDMSRFLDKWLLDMKSEQGRGGGIPMVIPRGGDGWPIMTTSCWGDSSVLVPWAEYLARGDIGLLHRQYPVMKKFLKAAKFWAGFLSIRPSRRMIWRWLFHFGDWCAPGEGIMKWLGKGKWVGTAYFANSCLIVSEIAKTLGFHEDAAYYLKLREKICAAYRKVFTDKKGKLKREFQTAYVLPLYFNMTEGGETAAMAANLSRLVKDADYHLTTGFTGTPYLLFALSDNGHTDVAFKLLLQETCPSWLYEVKAGGTTIWERWDALSPDGTVNTSSLFDGEVKDKEKEEKNDKGGMVSFNHYANGAVGDFLYRRVAGIEVIEPGYRKFSVKPVIGGGLTYAKATYLSPYGKIVSDWKIEDGKFTINVAVPVSTECVLTMPGGKVYTLQSGNYSFSE